MTFAFAPSAATAASAASAASPAASRPLSAGSVHRFARMLEPAEWAAAGIPLLRSPREVVGGLHARHRPTTGTAVVAVLDHEERLAASASFTARAASVDGWELRNALLTHLRRVVPHDLRRRSPVRTAVLLYCRDGDERWTAEDGAWMWGLRDACTLHGLRCGAYITLTRGGWQVLGDGRGGRRPSSAAGPESSLDAPGERAGPPASGPGSAARNMPGRSAAH
ncbi:hypothetical protein ACGFW5_08700 [Streptomyces sp. NPDC048416]|uniref:hypothetical protein n=1 Tax=Streptomyces sp. NPDC048416 TaxID=3365546 RepID=UPI0037167B99